VASGTNITKTIELVKDKRAIGSFKRQFIQVFTDKGIREGKMVYVDGHFKPY
jgi:hypothetical protein